jgi:hypothetical protein
MKKLLIALAFLPVLFLLAAELPAQPTNYQISRPLSPQLQNEEQILYHPIDPNVIVCTYRDFQLGYRRCSIARSTNNGATWNDYLNDLLMNFNNWQSDPTATYDAAGNFILCYLDFSSTFPTSAPDSSFVIFIRSTDKGETWEGPYPVVDPPGPWFEDKQFITADRTGGAHDGNVYVGWARFPNPTRIMFARSTDGGVNWSDTLVVGPKQPLGPCGSGIIDAGQFTQPIVDADGDVYVFWSGTELDQDLCVGYYTMKMSKSTDGGQTFSIPEPIFLYYPVGTVDGSIQVYNAPAGDADISGGPYDGNIYISTTNGNASDVFYHADIDFIKSTDGGQTWLDPLRINDDPLGVDVDQFHPWLVVNDEGIISVIFYDQRIDPAHYEFDVFAAYSFDGGETFTTNERITDVSSSPDQLRPMVHNPYEGRFDDNGDYIALSPLAGKIAEYIGVSMNGDNVTAAWTDTRNGNQDVFGATWTLPFLKPRLFGVADGGYMGSGLDSLWWSTCWKESDDQYRVEIDDDPGFGSIDVSEVVTDNKLFSTDFSLPDGVYHWRVKGFRISADDSTSYSSSWTFEIDTFIQGPPDLFAPIGGELTTEASPIFMWGTLVLQKLNPDAPQFFRLQVSDNSSFDGSGVFLQYEDIVDDGELITVFPLPDPLPAEGIYFWRVQRYDLAGNTSAWSTTGSFEYLEYICGDADGNLTVNISDAVYIVNWVFKGGPAPDPLAAGDANNDGNTNISDAVHIIDWVFKGGPAPCE